jgi:hypothetical protein
MISGKPTISSNEKNTIPQKTHENSKRTYSTVQEHYNSLRERLRVNKEAKTH